MDRATHVMACTLDIQPSGQALSPEDQFRLPSLPTAVPEAASNRIGQRLLADLLDFEGALAPDAPELWSHLPESRRRRLVEGGVGGDVRPSH